MVQSSRPVGRPREFNEETTLKAVMEVFWEKGFEATSLNDLCKATGLHKGSLYQAFGDKHQLFMLALHQYSEDEFNDVISVVSKDVSPLTNIRAVVDKICCNKDRGCMVINSMVELSKQHPDVRKAVEQFRDKRLNAMSSMIAAAQEAGEIRKELKPEHLAMEMMIALAGASATVKTDIDQAEIVACLHRIIDYWQ